MSAIVAWNPHPTRRPWYKTPEREKYLRDNPFLDVSILAAEVGLSYRLTYRFLRDLGLRKCRNNRNEE
jgi:hypothetical protein